MGKIFFQKVWGLDMFTCVLTWLWFTNYANHNCHIQFPKRLWSLDMVCQQILLTTPLNICVHFC